MYGELMPGLMSVWHLKLKLDRINQYDALHNEKGKRFEREPEPLPILSGLLF